jgi:DNA repair ATPase RecN
MTTLLKKIQSQLDSNHYVEKEDIQALIDGYRQEYKEHQEWASIAKRWKKQAKDWRELYINCRHNTIVACVGFALIIFLTLVL